MPCEGVTTSTTLTQQSLALNLYTGAWTCVSNFMHRGGINLPAETGKKTWAVLTNSSDVAKLVEVESLFTSTGTVDAETSETSSLKGPKMHIEYRRANPGDPDTVFYWKNVILKAKATGDELLTASVPDIESTSGQTLGDDIDTDTDFEAPKIVRISRRSTHMGFRIYEDPAGTTLTDAKIGPGVFQARPLRLGRDAHAA